MRTHSTQQLRLLAIAGVIALVPAVLASNGALAGTPSTATPSTASTTSADLAHETTLRAKFGLDASSAHVADVDAADSSDETELGIPLSPAETVEMQARDLLPGFIAKIESALGGLGILGSYAGAWTDQIAGGVLHFQFTSGSGAADVVAGLIKPLLPSNVKFAIDIVKYTASQLQAGRSLIVDGIEHDAAWMPYFGMDEIDDLNNRVLLVMKPETPNAMRADLESELHNSAVTITYGEQTFTEQSRLHLSGPVYGGEWIHGQGNCTAGYSHSRGGTGDTDHYYSVTAGHCGINGFPFYQGTLASEGNKYGTGHNNGYYGHTSSVCDCVAVGPVPASAVTNKVYTSNTALYAYGRTATAADYKPLNKVCLSGAAYGDAHGGKIVCDQIQASTAECPNKAGSFTLIDGFTTYLEGTLGGDSGGPEGNGKTFLGIHNSIAQGSFTGTCGSKSGHFKSVTGTTPTY